MNRLKFHVLLILVVSFCNSCRDIIEKNIENEIVVLNAPSDSINSRNLNVTFWWNEIDGALAYRLQVVSPNFSRVAELVLDTLVNSDKFIFLFSPGQYQWRVRAENGSSYTQFTTRSFFVDSTFDLSSQIITLESPKERHFANNKLNLFKWMKISMADDYRFEILDSIGSIVFIKPSIITDTISFNFLNEGRYIWRVQGHNNLGQTTKYTTRNIYIDFTSPNVPIIISPKNDSLVSNNFSLIWSRGAPNGVVTNEIRDSLYIYADNINFTIIKSIFINSTTINDSLPSGDYFWRVKSIDEAGNKSAFSNLNRFIIP